MRQRRGEQCGVSASVSRIVRNAGLAIVLLGFAACGGTSKTGPGGTSKTGPNCVPTTCASTGKNCDSMSDGCGNTLNCGTCASGETCAGGGVANVCGSLTMSDVSNGLLPQDRVTVWKPGLTYNGSFPDRSTECAQLSPLGGNKDDTQQIKAALSNCPEGQTVKLGPGTFLIASDTLSPKSNTTLRGSGPGTTILHSANQIPVLYVGIQYKYSDQRYLTVDAKKDDYSVTVDSTTGLLSGEIVAVDEQYDPGLTMYIDGDQDDDYLGSGECRCSHIADGSCTNDRGTGCSVATTIAQARAQSRPIGQMMEIASIKNQTITFSTPIHMPYRISKKARLARVTGGAPAVTKVGIEELTVSNGGGNDDAGIISFAAASYSWAKHVETTESYGPAVLFKGAFRCELRDSYIHSTGDPNPGGGGYGIAVDSYSAENLVENNISWNFNKVMVMRSSGGGNVIGYNYMQDGWGQGYPTLPEVGINASHMTTPQHELFEGNESHNFSSDTTHGNTIYITAWRNHLTGLRIAHDNLPLSDQGNRRAIDINEQCKWFSFVGNVLGYENMPLNAAMPGGNSGQTSWGYEPADDDPSVAKMWQLMHADADAQSSLLRQGNFDWVTKTQKWLNLGGIGTPEDATQARDIPASLYITNGNKPAFMGNNPWPWVDPTTGNTAVLPARARFDAGTPNTL